jgi:hypothetical protein
MNLKKEKRLKISNEVAMVDDMPRLTADVH